MSKKTIKNKTKKCTGCGAEAGLLLVTLPSNVFRRPQTDAEKKYMAQLKDTGALTFNELKQDQRRRKVRYCPDCIKPVRKKFGKVQNTKSQWCGEDLPVGLWGQR